MGFDLDKIPDGPGKPSAQPAGGFDLDAIPNSVQPTGTGLMPGADAGFSFEEFRFQPKVGVDNYLLRAQDQGTWEQLGKTLGNTISNVATGVIEGFGYIPELWDDSRDYTNALTRTMEEWKNPFGEVYRENPNETFDLSDPAWWMNNFQGLVESAGAFAIEGLGLAKLFGGMAKGAAVLGRTAGKIGNAAAQGASAATLAYTEGAMSGAHVYEKAYQENYNKAIQNGHDQTTAHTMAANIAGNAAATTVKLNTMMNTVMNLGSLAPLFRNPTDEVLTWFKTEGVKGADETLSAWKKRLATAAEKDPALKAAISNRGRQGWSSMLSEMQKEGVEEVNTQYAEAEGMRVANGEDRGIFQALTDVGQYFDDVTNEEGALNYILGMVGGGAQTVLVDNIPSKRILRYDEKGNPIVKKGTDGGVVYDKDGKPKYETKLVSARRYNAFGSKQYYENIRDSVMSDIDFMEKKNAELIAAKAKGNEAEAERIRGEIFNVTALDAVRKGLTDSWVKMYQEIAGIDNNRPLSEDLQPQIDELLQQATQAKDQGDEQTATQLLGDRQKLLAEQAKLQETTEAMQKGFAKDMKDNAYQERARQAADDLKSLQQIHEQVQKKYYDASSPATAELTDHLFFRTADLYMRKKAIEREEARIQKLEQMYEGMTLPGANAFDVEVGKYNDHINTINQTVKALQDDMTAIEAADKKGDIKVLQQMIEKYRAKGTHDEDIAGAINDLARKLHLKAKQYETSATAARKSMEDGIGFSTWKENNPDGTFDDYTKTVGQNVLLQNDKANLEMQKIQRDIAEKNLNELTDQKSVHRMLKAFAEQKEKMLKQINERNKKQNVEDFLRLQTREAAARLDVKQKQALAAQLNQRIAELTQQLNDARLKKAETDKQLRELVGKGAGVFTKLDKIIPLRSEQTRLSRIISSLEAQLTTAKNQLELLNVKVQEAKKKEAKVKDTTITQLNQTEKQDEEEDNLPVITPDTTTFDPLSDSKQSDLKIDDLIGPEQTKLDEYMEIRKSLHPLALPILDKLEQQFRDREPSYQAFVNAFREMQNLEYVTQAQVNGAFFAFRDFILDQQEQKNKPIDPQLEEVQPTNAREAIARAGLGEGGQFFVTLVDGTRAGAVRLGMSGNELDTSEGLVDLDLIIKVENPDGRLVWEKPQKISTSEIPQEIPDGQPEIVINPDLFSQEELSNRAWEDAPKTEYAVKVNGADLQYETIPGEKTIKIRNLVRNGAPQLDPDTNIDRLIPGRISVGDEVELQIDTEWQGMINIDDRLEVDDYMREVKRADQFSDYLDDNGLIRTQQHEATVGYGNVPIKIVHKKTGKVIGYFPRVDWITATAGQQGFRNVTDNIHTPDGNIPGNVDMQASINLQIRKKLAEMHNANPGATLKTVIASHGPGRVLYHSDVNTEGRVRYLTRMASNLLPDKNLRFGVWHKVGPMIGKGTLASNSMKLVAEQRNQDKMIGAPVVFLPMPNGQFKASPLGTTRLADRETDMRTIERSIELYLQHGTPHLTPSGQKIIDKIRDTTGFDITTEQGLSDFINQYYTYTSNFEDSSTAADAAAVQGEGKVQKFMLAIPRRGTATKAPIKAGVKFSGYAPAYAKLKNGKLDPVFSATIRAGLAERFKNVVFTDGNIQGVNSSKPIYEIRINKNDVASARKYDNYNEYLKSFTITAVHGLTQVDGQYIYAANAQMQLDEEMLLPSADQEFNARDLMVESNPLDAGQVEQQLPENTDAIDDLFSFNTIVPENVRRVIQPEGIPMNLANLRELHNLVPESARNAKSPEDVLKEMQQLGINRIADGYNPFLKCN
jgi:hypothetical protein